MSDTAQFTIGTEASCTDGVCGEVSRVVIDPVARAVTHLVVEPKHRRRHGRLVPLDLVDASDGIRLRCTLAEFEQLEHAEEARFLPGSSYAGYGPDQALSWPYYGSRMPTNTNWFGMGRNAPTAKAPRGAVVVDAIPLGEVAVRRGEPVHATDGDIGRVQGLVINPDRHVTHVLLQDGHLWGRRQVAIPIGSVTRVDDGIRLDLTKQEVHDLAPVEIEHSDH